MPDISRTVPVAHAIPLPDRRLLILGALLAAAVAAYLAIGARGDWGFVLAYRGAKLAGLLLVGAAIGIATVLFQTVSGNRILTPSVMGFDALYILIQTGLVFALGGIGFANLDPRLKFLAEAALLLGAGVALFSLLLGRRRLDLHRMILAGLVFGVLFRSLTSFLQRTIDPTEYAFIQSVSFAQFSRVDGELLGLGGTLSVVAVAGAWVMRHRLDVIALGRDHAVSLGLDHGRELRRVLTLVAVLVSVSTALVGPMAFFGLLVAGLAHQFLRTNRHALLLPGAGLVAALVLVAGQTIFERLFGLASTLSVVVEFAGGVVFLAMVLGRTKL